MEIVRLRLTRRRGRGHLLLAFAEPLSQQVLLGRNSGLLKRPAKVGGGGLCMVELRFEFPKDRIKQIIGLKLSAIAKRFDGRHARCGTVNVRDCNGSVQGDDGRIVQLHGI